MRGTRNSLAPPHPEAGSSPRMRGTHRFDSVGHYPAGIIPAYAGNTSTSSMVTVRPPDHPRVCGEHSGVSAPSAVRAGSSPRMRGTQLDKADIPYRIGIIPAYAGNTMGPSPVMTDWRDHPHVCGEHWSRLRCCRLSWGSSPRMRGTLLTGMIRLSSLGIIPAYAGNTSFGL